jgi:hypothetical protein
MDIQTSYALQAQQYPLMSVCLLEHRQITVIGNHANHRHSSQLCAIGKPVFHCDSQAGQFASWKAHWPAKH